MQPISENTFLFHCLYPIELDPDTIFALSRKNVTLNDTWVRATDLTHAPHSYTEYHALGLMDYSFLVYRGQHDTCSGLLDGFSSDRLPSFATVDPSDTGYSIWYGELMHLFVIHFRLAVHVQSPDGTGQPLAPDDLEALYRAVRNALVPDPHIEATESHWAKTVKTCSIGVVSEAIKQLTGTTAAPEVRDSFGYIWVTTESHTVWQFEDDRSGVEKLHPLDDVGRQLPNMKQLTIAQPDSFVFLGWQMSSLLGVETETAARLFPVYFACQSIYYLLVSFFENTANRLLKATMVTGTDNIDQMLADTDQASLLLFNVEYALQRFKSALKPFQNTVLSSIWDYWNMPEEIDTHRRTLDRCLVSLKRKHDVQTARSESRQNSLLFVIAILQILSIMEFTSSFVELNSEFTVLPLVLLVGSLTLTVALILVGYADTLRKALRRKARRRKPTRHV